jgi:signal transduction histidine kinase
MKDIFLPTTDSNLNRLPYVARISYTVLTVLLVFVVRWGLELFFGPSDPFFFFTVAVVLSAWFGGFLAGLVATTLAVFLVDVLYLSPMTGPIANTLEEQIYLLAFFFQGYLFSAIINALQVTREQAAGRAELLTQLEKRKDEFISIASHELKTPLSTQKLYVELLQKNVTQHSHHQYETYLEKINNQNDKLTRLVNELLDISRIEGGKLLFEKKFFNFESEVRSLAEDFQAGSKQHKIVVEGGLTKQVYGDHDRLLQVVGNFISNAIKYSPEADRVTIKLSETDKEVKVSVKDYGIGIEREKQEHLFERFYRVHGADETHYPGMGIGLYIASEIVKKHGGRLKVTSNLGQGSTFSFTLPVLTKEEVKLVTKEKAKKQKAIELASPTQGQLLLDSPEQK